MKHLHPSTHWYGRSFAPLVLAGAFFLLSLFNPAFGASFNVTPILGDIPAGTGIAVFEVRNQGTETLPFQVQAFAWSQQNGADVRVPATDLLIVPPVGNVAPGRTQLIRIALRDKDRSREHAYRIVIRELPSQDPARPGFTLKTLLAFDVPLFFAPEHGTRGIAWRLEKGSNGQLQVHVNSTGSRFARFDYVRLLNGSGRELARIPGPLYVLAGASRSWAVQGSAASLPRNTPVKLVYSITGQEDSIPLKIE